MQDIITTEYTKTTGDLHVRGFSENSWAEFVGLLQTNFTFRLLISLTHVNRFSLQEFQFLELFEVHLIQASKILLMQRGRMSGKSDNARV